MLKFSRSRSFGRVAWVATLAMLSTVIAPALLQEQRGSAAAKVTRVAVAHVQVSGDAGPEVAEAAGNALALAFIQRADFDVVAGDQVKAYMDGKNYQPPFAPAELADIGNGVGADIVLTVKVDAKSIQAGGARKAVTLEVTGVDAKTGAVTRQAVAKGYSDVKRRSTSDQALYEQALKQAAAGAVDQLAKLPAMNGIVVSRPDENTVRTSIGTNAGLRNGATLSILGDDGSPAARARVIAVDTADSKAVLDAPASGRQVRLGARVLVLYNPPAEEAGPTQPEASARSAKKSATKWLVALLIAGVAYALLRNKGGGGDSTGATGIVAVPSVTAVPADGTSSTTITVTVRDGNGNPVPDGTVVNFKTDLGTITAQATTSSGQATATLVAGTTTGTATVTITVGDLTQTLSVQFTSASNPPAGIVVALSASSIPADGTSTVDLTVTVHDANRNPVADGTTVTFTTTLGTVTAQAVTSGGQATATLIAGTTPGLAVITIKVGNLTQTANVQLTSSNVSQVSISADATSIFADGSTFTDITVTFRDANNNAVPDNSNVDWTTNAGTLSPSGQPSAGLTSLTTQTSNGTTSVRLTSATSPGTAVVRATLQGTSTFATIPIVFATYNVQVTASPQEIVADGNSTSTITVTVIDSAGQPVPDNTVITFQTTLGNITQSATTTNGTATAVLTSGTVAGTARLTVNVLNANNQVIATNNVTFVGFAAGPAFQIGVGASSLNLAALDVVGAQNTITAVVKDANGNPVRDGTVVSFCANRGAVDGTGVTTSGVATAIWRSLAVDHDNPAVGTPGHVTVTAATTSQGGGQVSNQVCFIVSGAPATVRIISAPATVAIKGKAPFTVEVLDRLGNFVVGGTSLEYTTTLGTVSGGSTTDGIVASLAQGTITAPTAATDAGCGTITVRSGFASASFTVGMGVAAGACGASAISNATLGISCVANPVPCQTALP